MLMEAEVQMARSCFGYGRWDAPYWFIGPEQGQARAENADLLSRVEAWLQLGGRELNDCRAYHDLLESCEWHRELGPPLQATWKFLILLLLTYLEEACNKEQRGAYQREKWGSERNGETCIIELSGLPANNLGVIRDRERFLEERIETLRTRIKIHKPTFVVMYGKSARTHWEKIAGVQLEPGLPSQIGPTKFLFAQRHPTAFGTKNEHWIRLGNALRAKG
jgi:hypothetical protein